MTFILSLVTVGLLAAAVYFLKMISEQQTQVIRRLEILELVSHEDGREIERTGLTNPTDGLLIGSPAPDFELPDATGRIVAFEHLLTQAKPLLFFFVSPTCTPCAALMPEIEAWQQQLTDKTSFVFISSGKAEDNVEKFAGRNLNRILLQKNKEISALFGAQWTPTALLVNSDGTIGSYLAAGDKAIRELVGRIQSANAGNESMFISNATDSKLGNSVPDFSHTATDGKTLTSSDLTGKTTLVAFWSTTCPYCVNMLDELRDWEQSKGTDEPNLLVFSEGDLAANKAMNIESAVVLDTNRIISKALGMKGTPSAVLIDENGKIVSETAVGAPQIWALLGKKK